MFMYFLGYKANTPQESISESGFQYARYQRLYSTHVTGLPLRGSGFLSGSESSVSGYPMLTAPQIVSSPARPSFCMHPLITGLSVSQ